MLTVRLVDHVVEVVGHQWSQVKDLGEVALLVDDVFNMVLPLRMAFLMVSRLASRRSPARWINWSSFFPVLPLPMSSSAIIWLSWWMVDANSRSFASLAAAASNSELMFLMIVVICSRVSVRRRRCSAAAPWTARRVMP